MWCLCVMVLMCCVGVAIVCVDAWWVLFGMLVRSCVSNDNVLCDLLMFWRKRFPWNMSKKCVVAKSQHRNTSEERHRSRTHQYINRIPSTDQHLPKQFRPKSQRADKFYLAWKPQKPPIHSQDKQRECFLTQTLFILKVQDRWHCNHFPESNTRGKPNRYKSGIPSSLFKNLWRVISDSVVSCQLIWNA